MGESEASGPDPDSQLAIFGRPIEMAEKQGLHLEGGDRGQDRRENPGAVRWPTEPRGRGRFFFSGDR